MLPLLVGAVKRAMPHDDSLLPKPDRARLSPAAMGNGAGRGCFVVVRGCPLGTDEDRCEWHACGTVSEDDPRTPVAPLALPGPEGEARPR
jgi:hypothetical protein